MTLVVAYEADTAVPFRSPVHSHYLLMGAPSQTAAAEQQFILLAPYVQVFYLLSLLFSAHLNGLNPHFNPAVDVHYTSIQFLQSLSQMMFFKRVVRLLVGEMFTFNLV